jgi:hypothetical protein
MMPIPTKASTSLELEEVESENKRIIPEQLQIMSLIQPINIQSILFWTGPLNEEWRGSPQQAPG